MKADDVGARLKHVVNGQLVADIFFDLGVLGKDSVANHFYGIELAFL